jgi:shikimate kinase/3-dehydroquinate synthase
VGLRCSGKSSVARELAGRLGMQLVDLDDELARLHAEENGQGPLTAGDVLATVGEPAFRELERRALLHVLDREGPLVLATGGGVIEDEANRRVLREETTSVWLDVEPAELERRLRADPTPRPALLGTDAAAEVRALLERRAPWYAEVAALRLDCGIAAPGELAEDILRSLSGPEDAGTPERA